MKTQLNLITFNLGFGDSLKNIEIVSEKDFFTAEEMKKIVEEECVKHFQNENQRNLFELKITNDFDNTIEHNELFSELVSGYVHFNVHTLNFY